MWDPGLDPKTEKGHQWDKRSNLTKAFGLVNNILSVLIF